MREYPLVREAGLLIVYGRLSGPKGSELIRLALDTGATTTMVPPHVLLAIGVNPTRVLSYHETLTANSNRVPRVQVDAGSEVLSLESVYTLSDDSRDCG